MNSRNIRLSSRIAGLLAVSALATSAFAQRLTLPVAPLVSPPTAPTNLTYGDLAARHNGATPLTLEWAQFFPSGPGPVLNPLATHFIVCFRAYAGATAPPCSLASNDYLEAIAAPNPRLTRTGNFFRLSLGAIAESQLDKPFRFTVGACSALAERSCRYSGADIFYSTRNIVTSSAGVNALSNGMNWKINAQATNPGDSDVPKFSGLVEAFEVLGRGNPGRTCVTDVNDVTIRFDPTLVVLTKRGDRTPITMVSRDANGIYNGPEIAGVYRQGDFYTYATFVTVQPAIPANQVSDRGVGVVDFGIPTGPVQRTFVLATTLDSTYVVREYNEDDNVRAVCRVR